MAIITLPKTADGQCYKPRHNAKPGDVIELDGFYKLLNIDNVVGTEENPIIFKVKNPVVISGYTPYCFLISGKYFKIIGEGKIQIKGTADQYGAMGLGLYASSNYEISGVEFSKLKSGIVSNPVSMEVMRDIYIHHCRFTDFANNIEHRTECFYLGNTNAKSAPFENARIEDNEIENVEGDGIQVCQGTFTIRRNKITGWGKARTLYQRTGILVGNDASAVVEDNVLTGGSGTAFQNFGGGPNTFKGNVLSDIDVSGLTNEDIVYLAARSQNFSIDFSGNTFTNCKANRKLVYNGTPDSNTTGSKFSNNTGITKADTVLNQKDTWQDPPVSIPVPAPVGKKVIGELYDDGTWSLK